MSTSTATAVDSVSTAFRPSFYFWMTLLMAFFVFGGFGMTYWYPMAVGTFPTAPPVVHLHGLVFFCWMILLLVQSLLINVKNVALHRSLGTFGIALATAVIMMGLLITLLSAGAGIDNLRPVYDGIFLGIMAVTGFGFLFTLALRNTRKPEIHKRLILLAMLPILPPGIHRLYMVPFGLDYFPLFAMYMTLDAMAVMIMVHEWRNNGCIGIYTLIGVLWILVQQILHATIMDTKFFADFVWQLAVMVHYR